GPPRRWQQQGRLAPPARLAVLLPGPQPSPVGSADPRTPPVGVLVFSAPLAHASQWSRSQVELAQTVAESFGQALRRVQQRHELMVASQRDQLTGLHNLTSFRQRVAEERGSSCAVLMINLARLRAVNDVFGRDTGDAMIASAAARLADVAPDATLGRISGHHLAAAIDVETPGAAVHLARRVRTALEAPLQTDGLNAELGVTIGIALGPEHGSEPDLLLRRAEAAGDAAKEDPFGVAVFSPELEHDVARPLRLVSDLRKALAADDQLSLHYQPQLRLRDGQITSYEALIRWNHPTLGPVRPDEFIGLAESTGLISAVTDFTLDEALRQAAQWRRQGRPDRVAVNLSARTLLDDGLVRKVERLLAEHGCEPGQLILEITETSVMAQPMRSVLMLDALADLGVELSIDDFGTGYSNLAYLRDLPVHEVKLDRTFISSPHDGMPLGQGGLRAQAFLRHAIALVHALQLRVVVEGVEDALALHALRELGADAAQGYHICRPLPEAELQAWFESGPFATATDLGYGTRS
ncbi:MAG: putative signaling protein, partial [Frankiales bacterium]|nr:putative signaling protein [Frankiales bacterium]